jgi:hypothetical protein
MHWICLLEHDICFRRNTFVISGVRANVELPLINDISLKLTAKANEDFNRRHSLEMFVKRSILVFLEFIWEEIFLPQMWKE